MWSGPTQYSTTPPLHYSITRVPYGPARPRITASSSISSTFSRASSGGTVERVQGKAAPGGEGARLVAAGKPLGEELQVVEDEAARAEALRRRVVAREVLEADRAQLVGVEAAVLVLRRRHQRQVRQRH